MTMSEADNNMVLRRVKGWFESALTSSAYATWRSEARAAWDFYDGTQWTPEEISRLAENGQAAIVINKIAAKVDNLSGGEVVGRTRVIYRSRSGLASEEQAAAVLTDVALYVAEHGEQGIEVSNLFRAGLVGGIGWLDVGIEDSHEGMNIFVRTEDEFSVVWDPMSRRLDMGDARFVARERWLDEAAVRSLFPDQADKVMAALGEGGAANSVFALARGGRSGEVGYYDAQRGLYRLVEVQYKEPARQWRLRLPDGRLVVTFDRRDVRREGAKVEDVAMVGRVFVAYFAGDTLLDHRPLAYRHNGFTLIPFVYKRQRGDGRPYGLVRAAMDPQRELNKRRSKAMHLLNTAQVIADIDAVEDPNVLAREAARPDGIILKRAGKDLRILRNTDLAASQVSVMEQAGRDIQEVIGVYDETLGKQSNATSGVAIEQRQSAGSRNQMFAYDALRLVKKNLAAQVLSLMKQYFSPEMIVRISDRLQGFSALGRDQVSGLDFANTDFDVVVEEVRDVDSARELESQQLQALIQAGVRVPPEVLVEASGVRNKEPILAALKNSDQGEEKVS